MDTIYIHHGIQFLRNLRNPSPKQPQQPLDIRNPHNPPPLNTSTLQRKYSPTMRHITTSALLVGAASALTVVEHKPFMRKNIDPIVFPGKYISHMHSFYGSDALTKDLPTTEQLQQGCPSGENANDMSVYCTYTSFPSLPPSI